jgi:hypothetical protein
VLSRLVLSARVRGVAGDFRFDDKGAVRAFVLTVFSRALFARGGYRGNRVRELAGLYMAKVRDLGLGFDCAALPR